jgi:hypothetical protein
MIVPGETLIQAPDTSAEVMGVDDLPRSGGTGAFRELVGRYTPVVIAQMMQQSEKDEAGDQYALRKTIGTIFPSSDDLPVTWGGRA